MLICVLIKIQAMDKPDQLSSIKTNIKMRIERIAQLQYSIALRRINIAGLRARRLEMYRCSSPKLVAVTYDYWSSSDSDYDPSMRLFDD